MKRWEHGVSSPETLSPLPYDPAVIVTALAPLVYSERLDRIERAVSARIGSVVVVIESLNDPHNAAAILRTCDGFGVHEVDAIERDAEVMITSRVTTGCEKWMTLRRHPTPEACAASLRERGFALYVADMRATKMLDEVAAIPRVAVAFGNEHSGISPELHRLADGAFAIPMRGMVESFNVSVAAALTLGTITRNRNGDLGEGEALALKARFLMESVREADMVLERYARDHGIAARR